MSFGFAGLFGTPVSEMSSSTAEHAKVIVEAALPFGSHEFTIFSQFVIQVRF